MTGPRSSGPDPGTSQSGTDQPGWVVSWRLPVVALIAVTLLIPPGLYRIPSGLPMDLEPYRILVLLLLIMWGASLLTDERTQARRTGIDGAIGFVMLAVCLSLIVNRGETRPPDEFATALKALFYLSAPLILVYAITSIVRTREDLETALRALVWLGVVISVFGMVERLTQFNVFLEVRTVLPFLEYKPSLVGATSSMEARRIAGPSMHAIAFSVVLGMILPVAIHYARVAKSHSGRIVYGCATTAIATTMFLTGSRTAFVGFVVVLAILWLTAPQIRKWTIPALFFLAVVLHFAFPGAIGMLTERLSPAYLAQTETGNQAGRLADYPRILAHFLDRPLLGRGFGTFDPVTFFWVDNQYLVLAVEVGLLGLGAFIYFFWSAFRLLYRTGRSVGGEMGDLAVAMSASIAVFAVSTFTFDSFGFPQPFNLFFIIVGLGTALVAGLRGPDSWGSPSMKAPSGSST